jgi:deoxyribonucleoside regulator
MRAGNERIQLLIQVASLYYEQALTQQEVAQRLGLTRSNVSRLLAEARRQGVVEIRVRHLVPTVPGLETELRRRFQLQDVSVLMSGTRSAEMALRDVGVLAAERLRQLLYPGIILAIGWGRALYETVNAFRPVAVSDVQIVQMMGGVGAVNPRIDGAELARQLAEALGGQFHYLRAPFVVESAAVREALLRDRDVRFAIELARHADLAVTGIGSVRPELSGLLRAGYLTEDDLDAAAQRGAIGDLCGQYITVGGQICELELHRRVIGIDLPSLRKVRCVFAVAAWQEKAPAILGALRGGLVDILITDDAAAQEVLRLADAAT